MDIRPWTGDDLARALPQLARLRIEVFADWPYLYDGDAAYERSYLETFATARDALVVVAQDPALPGQDRIVGCATGSAIADHHAAFASPLREAGVDLSRTFYFGESVLARGYRGRGVGHAFFDAREDHARRLGYGFACFCAVVRPEVHPARPGDYTPLDAFWRRRGYAPMAGVIGSFSWKDHGEAAETAKPMQFWGRSLDA